MNKREITRPDGGSKAGKNMSQRIRTLPSCMDWIVFSRCGPKRKTKRKNSIERIATKAEPVDEEAGKAGLGEKGTSRPVDASPSPPGSTVDAADYPGEPNSAGCSPTADDTGTCGASASAATSCKAANPDKERKEETEVAQKEGAALQASENKDVTPASADGAG
eukprot:CAMPEP_0171158668 /NCGR_PEP_ID=MMETSP0790-20130122/2631_1 /TAXON_ID=2925 /ORGANISM="Alexandrium catenella, Strain OF101" /LENGTH=163 /DNA_ID=CAMNT_0011623119 /DNA_START=215 /DNA_END=703 /DNA_ORIENTATION=-